MQNGLKKWPTSHWQEMLRDILPIIEGTMPAGAWVLGGGTSIAMRIGHRISYDLDFFVESSRLMRAMTPHKNPAVKAFLGNRSYQFPGHYLKLELEHGEIDFIVASGITDEEPEPFNFEGREVLLEPVCGNRGKEGLLPGFGLSRARHFRRDRTAPDGRA